MKRTALALGVCALSGSFNFAAPTEKDTNNLSTDLEVQLNAFKEQMQVEMQEKLQEQQRNFETQLAELALQFDENLADLSWQQDTLRHKMHGLASSRRRTTSLSGALKESRRESSSATKARVANTDQQQRRQLSDDTMSSGLAIKSDSGSITFGSESDVALRRTAESTVSLVGNLEVTGQLVGAALANGTTPQRICVGHSPHMEWEAYGDENVYQDIDISQCNFTQTPEIFTSMSGTGWHWMATGMTSIYSESSTSFRVYIHHISDGTNSIDYSSTRYWSMNWMAIGI